MLARASCGNGWGHCGGMGRVRIPYYVVIKGRGYWRPTKAMRARGFRIVACGPDGPEAWRVAATWAARWQRARTGQEPDPTLERRPATDHDAVYALRSWPRGSLGEAFGRYRRTEEWRRKAPATRAEWDRAWSRVEPILGDVAPATVSLEDISALRLHIEQSVSLREAHRVVKVWRALWKAAAAMHYCERDADPSLGVRNSAAKGRTSTWTEGEAVRLVKVAWRTGHRGLAAALAVMWDSQLSPGDVRALTAAQVRGVLAGGLILTERAKTGRRVGSALSPRTARLLRTYVAAIGAELLDDAPVFRTKGHASGDGRPWLPRPYTKDKLGEDFREIRAAVFGPREDRQMLDFRRSGAREAIAGAAEPTHLAHAMGNTLSASNALFETYAPADVTSLQEVARARQTGRRKLRDGNGS